MFDELTSLKTRLDAHRPFTPAQIEQLTAVLLPPRIYLTNSFGDNSLTLEETRYFLETQRLVGGKLEREFQEIRGVQQALKFLDDLISKSIDLDETSLQRLHAELMSPINGEGRYFPGQYRTMDAYFLGQDGSRINFTPYPDIAEQMRALLEWYHLQTTGLHPVELAARFAYRLAMIHPFVEGNGRLGRLIGDFILERAGLGPALVDPPESYFAAMREADHTLLEGNRNPAQEQADLTALKSVIERGCRASLQMMLDVLENRYQAPAPSLESRMKIFDRIISGSATQDSNHQLQEEKETTKLALTREVEETLKTKVRSQYVKFTLSGPAKFQQNNQQYSLLIAEITARHHYTFSPSEIHYEYHLGPDLGEVEASGLPLKPFMKLLSFAILSHGQNVGIFSSILEFEFGTVYIKQENRSELILHLQPDSIREFLSSASYQDWDINKLKAFLFNSLDNYFQHIESHYLKETANHL